MYTEITSQGWRLMSKKTIEKNLIKALLNDGEMAFALFQYELEEHVDEYLKSKQEDKDDYFFAVTEHTNDVAMLLIDGDNKVHVNEEARTLLKVFWPKSAYKHNMQILIPQMVDELSKGFLFTSGVKIQGR
jgi:hypothetical protein